MTNRILLVEDDPTSRRMLATMLTDMGHGVTSAASGDEALQYLYTDEPCDLVLADIVMPGMSGIELKDRANDARPGLPLILVSGKPSAISKVLDEGGLVLPKPVTRATLTSVIEDVLSR